MALTAVQMGLCFQSYWYMWLATGLSGLLFIGINIGIAAFFLINFRQQSNYQQSSDNNNRPFSPSEISAVTENERRSGSRGFSGKSDESGSVEADDDFTDATLEEINKVRRKYNAPSVELNPRLSMVAQRWANQLAKTNKLEHSPAEMRSFGRQILGENYIAVFQTELTANQMVRKWIKERHGYQFGSDGRRETENFTQLVWQATQEIGVGRAKSEVGWWYGVVVFDPPGNIPNQFANNVRFTHQ